jgi:hypothetical protein
MRMSVLGLAAAAAVAGATSIAEPARADVYFYRPAPYYFAYRAPLHPYAYARTATWARPAAYGCSVRVTRAWVNGHYVSRRVRRCV